MRHNHDIAFIPAAEVPYAVGRGRPPQHSRFRPGQSGNPRGRPKGSRNLLSCLRDALNEKVTVTETGRSRQIPKAEVIAKQLVNRAAGKGDLAATKLVLILMKEEEERLAIGPQFEPGGEPRPTRPDPDPLDSIDFGELSTAQLEVVYEAARILEGKQERPPIPMPPEDPGARRADGESSLGVAPLPMPPEDPGARANTPEALEAAAGEPDDQET